MAGEWIKMRSDLHEDPAVFRLATILQIDKYAVVGRLHKFWSWADIHSVDGVVDGLTSTDIDEIVRLPGFVDAMASVHWLIIGDGFVEVPNFDRHNSESAKKRDAKNRAQAKWRANVDISVDKQVSTSRSTNSSTREEKRREDSKPSPIPPEGGVPVGIEKPSAKKRDGESLKNFLDRCRTEGVKPIPQDDPIFTYVGTVGLTDEMLVLCWFVFKNRYLDGKKLQKDWRAHYRNAVKSNWFKLWFIGNDGSAGLTTAGQQAQREMDAIKPRAA